MSKVKLNKHAESVQTNGQAKHAKKKKKPDKKAFFFHTKPTVKQKTKPETAKPSIMPPTEAHEYSCNWKNLLQVRGIVYHGKIILNSFTSAVFATVCVCVCVDSRCKSCKEGRRDKTDERG